MSSSNKIDLLRDFAAGVYLSEAKNRKPHTPPPPGNKVKDKFDFSLSSNVVNFKPCKEQGHFKISC